MKNILLTFLFCPWLAQAEPLRICATIPDLGDLFRQIGGEEVTVTVFAKGAEDAHFVEARPSFIKATSQADVFVQAGLELELGWAPLLLEGARNPRITADQPGFIDAGSVIQPLAVPEQVDRSMGDVHPGGNPHFLIDPENARKVARLITDRLILIRPEKATDFETRFATFSAELDKRLADWTEAMKPFAGTLYVADHDMWPYLAKRFGLVPAGFLEPKPGLSPTTKHLQEVIALIKNRQVPLLITSSYYNPRHAEFVGKHSAAKIVPLAHQVGAREGTDTYLSMMDYNLATLIGALSAP